MVWLLGCVHLLPLVLAALTLIESASTWFQLRATRCKWLTSPDCVKHENFKTCDQSGFCKRNRAYADNAASLGTSWVSPYVLDSKTIKISDGYVTGTIFKTIGEGLPAVELPLIIHFQEPGVARITIDEAKRQKGDIEIRHNSQARKERYNEVSYWALVGQPISDAGMKGETAEKETIVSYGPGKKYKAIVRHDPFSIDFFRDEKVQVMLNGNGLMNVEHWRAKVEKEVKEGDEKVTDDEDDEKTWWEESFGGNTDSKPRGPESVGIDITFPEYEHVYGIPGHTGPLSLKETR